MADDELTLALDRLTPLVLAGFGRGDNPEAVLREGLGDPHAHTRIVALRGLHRQGLLDTATWQVGLRDHDADVRRETLVLLADSPAEAVSDDDLRELFADADPLVVDAAVFVVGEHHRAAFLDVCVTLAGSHEDARVREAAVAALGVVGDRAGLPAILAAFDDKPPVRRRAVVALSNFEGPEVDEALARAREDRDWQVRAAADVLSE